MTKSIKQNSSIADLATAMGHTLRIQILQELTMGSCIVSELMDMLAVEASLLSKHRRGVENESDSNQRNPDQTGGGRPISLCLPVICLQKYVEADKIPG